jgi:hypothetical protein
MKYLKVAAAAALTAGALAVGTLPAHAQTAPGYEEFAGCPEAPGVVTCLVTQTNGGHMQFGTKDTPITEPIILRGGLTFPGGRVTFNEQGGLDAQPLRVPGGLSGLTGLPEELIDLLTLGAHQVHALPALVGDPTFVGGRLRLPLEIKLMNPFLSPSCAIGSAAEPVVLVLTTGTTSPPPPNQPISGSPGTVHPDPNLPGVTRVDDSVFVDNAFAVPAARGCDLTGFGVIDALVNLQSGLPSPAGMNTAVMEDTDNAFAAFSVVYP